MRKINQQIENLNFPEFLDRLRNRDAASWSRFDFVLKRILFKWMARKGVKQIHAEEIYNESLATFLEKFETLKFNDFSGMKSYLFSVAENKTREFWRKKNMDSRKTEIDPENFQCYADYSTIDEKLVNQEQLSNVEQMINSLSKQEQLILNYFYKESFSMEEIAGKMELSTVNVRVIKHRAIAKLKNKINPQTE